MDDIVIASSEADARAAEEVEQHHAQLAGALGLKVDVLVDAAERSDPAASEAARSDLAAWCARELVPHALAEEKVLYPVARDRVEGRLLVDGMLGEHTVITGLVDEIATATAPVRAAAAATALLVMFQSHLRKENELVLPVVLGAPDVSLAALLEGMHDLLGANESVSSDSSASDHACGCGESDGHGYPELDARIVPHKIRHATVFGALDGVAAGDGIVLIAPHDPLPLLAQIEQRYTGAFSAKYLERGPEAWRLAIVRTG